MCFVQYGGTDRLRAYCTVGRLRVHFVYDGHSLFLLSFSWCLDVLDWATPMVATAFRHFSGFLDDLLRGLAGARREQARRARMILRGHFGKRAMQAIQFIGLDALRLTAGAG